MFVGLVRMNRLKRLAGASLIAVSLAACQGESLYGAKHLQPVSHDVRDKMQSLNMSKSSPVLVRIFKEEAELEVWRQTKGGKYALLETYEICKWSGNLGPKFKEGDRQAPEGYYTIRPAQMNPNSSYHLSFNLGFPNAFDRAHGRTGSHLMVHGACSSRGCYAMEDDQIQDIYAMGRDAFLGGQRAFQVHAYPFRMTAKNLVAHYDSPHIDFWHMLKDGYDQFDLTKIPPSVDVCGKRYVFNAKPDDPSDKFVPTEACPAYSIPRGLETAMSERQKRDNIYFQSRVAKLSAKKEKAAIAAAEAKAKAQEKEAAEIQKAALQQQEAVDAALSTGSVQPQASGAIGKTAAASKKMLGFFTNMLGNEAESKAAEFSANTAPSPVPASSLPKSKPIN
ncbi:MAG: murein L,D-transpeptidase family protein [Stappiaceae bacterium]